VIRAAGERDLDRLTALYSLLLHEHAADEARFGLRPGGEEVLRQALRVALQDPDRDLRLAEGAPDQIEGFCLTAIARRPDAFRESARGAVEQLFVRPEARRGGIGQALLQAALVWLRGQGVGRLQVEVARGNPTGRAFWDAQGFRPAMDVLDREL
jgi:GNAT superfamily N-acetyltransferase